MHVPSKAIQPTAWLLGERLPDPLRRMQVLRLPAPILQSISQLEPIAPKMPPVALVNHPVLRSPDQNGRTVSPCASGSIDAS